jgi:hypothetical protein
MLHEAPGFVQLPCGFIKVKDDALEAHFAPVLLDYGIQLHPCSAQCLADVVLDRGWGESGPPEVEVLRKEGTGHQFF